MLFHVTMEVYPTVILRSFLLLGEDLRWCLGPFASCLPYTVGGKEGGGIARMSHSRERRANDSNGVTHMD